MAVDQAPGVIVAKWSLDEFAKPYTLAHIPTAMSRTAWAANRERQAEQNAERAAQAGGVEASQPDYGRDEQSQHEMAQEDYSPQP